METKGLKVLFLGDSITEGIGASSPEKAYVHVLADILGFKEYINYGIGGTRIARQNKPSENKIHDLDFCRRVEEMDSTADIIVVFGGTNDHMHGDARLGTSQDELPDSFYGACNYLFRSLRLKYPMAKIVVLTPLRNVYSDDPKGNGWRHFATYTMDVYADVIKKTAAQHGLPVLDIFEDSDFNPFEADPGKRLYYDGSHPNDRGHALIAEKLALFMRSL